MESPTGAFEPFVVHYAETFIVPAAVGAYTIRPPARGAGNECATIKAFVGPGRTGTNEPPSTPALAGPGPTRPDGLRVRAGVFGPEAERRRLDAIRQSLRDPGCEGPDPVYAIAMDVGRGAPGGAPAAPAALRCGHLRRRSPRRGAGAQPGPRPRRRPTAAGRPRSCTRSGAVAPSSYMQERPATTPGGASPSRPAPARRWWSRQAGPTPP